jgi:DNA repair exonuclease SbcCD ATPase subunit
MSNLITLTCPSCGGRLEVTNNTERYVCAHCGNSHIVDPGVRAESLASEVEALKNESAIRRLDSEIEDLEKRKQELQASAFTIKSPEIEAALVKWLFVGLLIVVVIGIVAIGAQIGNGENLALYLIVSAPLLAAAILLAKYGMLDKTTRERWQARYEATANELNDIERQIARKREELERRKVLPMAGHYQQPTTNY